MGNHTTQNSTLGHTPFETVAEEVFRRYGRVWAGIGQRYTLGENAGKPRNYQYLEG